MNRTSRESGREFLIRDAPEISGYGLYSYLLFGSPPTETTRDRYLKTPGGLILAFCKISALLKSHYRPDQLNITYLPMEAPANDGVNAAWLLDHYNFAKARSLLVFFWENARAVSILFLQ